MDTMSNFKKAVMWVTYFVFAIMGCSRPLPMDSRKNVLVRPVSDAATRAEIASRSLLLTRAFLKSDFKTLAGLTSDSNIGKQDGTLHREFVMERRGRHKLLATAPIDSIAFSDEYLAVCMELSAVEGPILTDWVGPGRYAHSGAAEVTLRVNHRPYRQIWLLDSDGKWRCMFPPLDLDEKWRKSIIAELKKSDVIH